MAGLRKAPINAYIRQLMDESNAETLKSWSNKTGMPYAQAVRYADINDEHQVIESLYRDALLAGCDSLDEFILGLLPKLKKTRAEILSKRNQTSKAV